jgi:hypothetical protein
MLAQSAWNEHIMRKASLHSVRMFNLRNCWKNFSEFFMVGGGGVAQKVAWNIFISVCFLSDITLLCVTLISTFIDFYQKRFVVKKKCVRWLRYGICFERFCRYCEYLAKRKQNWFLILNWTPCHEDVLGDWRYSSTISDELENRGLFPQTLHSSSY